MTELSAETVRRNLDRVRNELADAGADPDEVTIIAVTKGFGVEAVRAAVAAGIVDLGENYAQELLGKLEALSTPTGESVPTPPRWHFIGRLQTNKVKPIADHVTCWQTVDRSSVVDAIARRAPGARVLIQVNATGEDHKGGAVPGAVDDLVARARAADLEVDGLMAVGVAGDAGATETAFATVVSLADRLELRTRSLGMTGDLAVAARAGTTMVRIGTGLFGPRPPRPA